MRQALFLVALIGIATLGGCGGGVLDPKGPVAFSERQILFDATGIMLVIVIPVMLGTLGVAFWFRASNTRASYLPDFKESGRIEILIWSIPLMTVLLVGTVAWISSKDLDPPRSLASSVKPVQVQVVALDWKWLFIYPEEGVASVNQLVVPVGTPVRLELTSAGPMNSFFVPQLAGQIYTMAGMVTHLNLQADYSGTYRGMSANFSGDGFADMHFNVDAVPPERFADWVVSVRSRGLALDRKAFGDLVKPSSAVTPFTYRSIAPGLFTDLLGAGSQSTEGLCTRYPESQRAER